MSDYEHKKGKLVEVDLNGLTVEEKAREILGNVELESYHSDYLEKLKDDFYKEYYNTGNKLFKIENVEEIDQYDDIYNGKKLADGSIEFEVKFYNGGCCLDEALDSVMENIEEER